MLIKDLIFSCMLINWNKQTILGKNELSMCFDLPFLTTWAFLFVVRTCHLLASIGFYLEQLYTYSIRLVFLCTSCNIFWHYINISLHVLHFHQHHWTILYRFYRKHPWAYSISQVYETICLHFKLWLQSNPISPKKIDQ